MSAEERTPEQVSGALGRYRPCRLEYKQAPVLHPILLLLRSTFVLLPTTARRHGSLFTAHNIRFTAAV